LMAEGNEALRTIFADPYNTELFYGVDAFNATGHAIEKTNRTAGRLTPDLTPKIQGIITLAEAVGVRRWLPPNVEQSVNYHHLGNEEAPNADHLLNDIAAEMGFDIRFPSPFTNEQRTGGVHTARGLVTFRAVQALYSCYRVMKELSGDKDKNVLEIGPGLGRTIFFLYSAGFRNLTTVDLPMGIVCQARFLGPTLGPHAIWMKGDPPERAQNCVRLLPTSDRKSLPRTDLVLNVDSIVEMGSEADAWAAWISSNARIFVSINHEATTPTVADIGRRYFGSAYSHRSPWWIRPGYVEDVFRFDLAETMRELAVLGAPTSWKLTARLRAIRNKLRFP
jgi:hypothetical protein